MRSLIILFSFVLLLFTGAHKVSANTSPCIDPQKAERLISKIRERLQDRQLILSPSEYTISEYVRLTTNRYEHIKEPFTDEEIACLGFRFKYSGIYLPHNEVAGRVLPAYLLLDESMLPAALRDNATRPEYYERKPGRTIKIKDRFRFARGAGGVYNWLTKAISFPLEIMNFKFPSMTAFLSEYKTERDHFHAATGWKFWQCGRSQLEGSFGIILHEYGHNIDFALQGFLFGKGDYSSATDGWRRLRQQEYISPYAETSRYEDFAESFVTYLMDPLMKCYAPGKYEWMSQFVQINADIYDSRLPFENLNCADPRIQILLADREAAVKKIRSECAKE